MLHRVISCLYGAEDVGSRYIEIVSAQLQECKMSAAGGSAWDFDFLLPGALGRLAVLCHQAQRAGSRASAGWGVHGGGRGKQRSFPGPGQWGGGFGGPGGAWWFGQGGPGGAGPKPPKASRGDVRAAILAVLSDGPRNGYQIMSEIEERSGGAWRPSPGAVYPALSQLADEGLIVGEESGGRRSYQLSDAGREYITEHPEAARGAWESQAQQEAWQLPGLFTVAARLGGSIVQVAHAGTPSQVRAAEELLEQTRRKLYQILAEDPSGEPDDAGEPDEQ
jgi:DNA-binding PadR family transcriptional regulator